MEKLLSMCFPIYNRLDVFKYTFSRTMEQVIKLNSEEIEVVVSVNPDESVLEETKKFLYGMQNKYGMVVNINDENLGISGNGRKVFELANGKYIWMIGDDDFVLPGCLDRILRILKRHPDIGWYHLAFARLNGYPNDEKAIVQRITSYFFTQKGYKKNGKKTVIDAHNKIGGDVLFSSANIFLREAWEEVAKEHPIHNPQLGATFCAASNGAAYLDIEVGVVAGGIISWSDRADYSNVVSYFRDMYFAIGHGFSQQEINNVISYCMRHEALCLWFYVYRLILARNPIGKRSMSFLFRIMPLQTILTTVFLPFIGCYLWLRHSYRNYLRKQSCKNYVHSVDADPYVVERIQGRKIAE